MLLELVHVVDDDADVRNSVAFLLQSAGLDVRTYESAAALLAAAATLKSGCIITDVQMPAMSGLELQRRLRASQVTLPVIVITGHADVPLAVEALKAGAVDFIEKPFEHSVLLAAVRSALHRSWNEIDEALQKSQVVARLASLTPRERQVLDRLVAGKTNKAVAQDLEISPRTVEVFRANIKTKMQAASLSELVRLAILGGVLPVRQSYGNLAER